MAIVQISKIQQRSGNLVDLPQLDEAEFGWASDAKRLFIGKTTPNENVEVLTSYSTVSFSQIDGSYGNLDIANAVVTGQLMTYNKISNTWVNTGGNALDPGNSSYFSNTPVHLGNVANVKIGGGAIGYVLETDGQGNLSWTSKGTLRANIANITHDTGNANIIVVTVPNTTPYTNSTAITISGANGVSNSVVNGNTFYVKVASDFATSGNVTLYSDITLTTAVTSTNISYTNSPNALAITSLGSTGAAAAGGTQDMIQFNNSGILDGNAAFTYNLSTNLLTLNGNANVANLISSGVVSGSNLVSNVATGTAPLTVTSTTRVSNLSVAYSNVSDFGVTTVQTTGTFFPVFVNGSATANRALGANANLSFNAATGNLSTTLLNANGNANVGNLGTAGLVVATGNVTGGNLVTGGAVSATGNVTGGNLVTAGALSVTGNANTGNLGTTTAIITTGNITTINSGLLQNGNSNVTITANGNVSIQAAGSTVELVVTSTGANINGTLGVSGNANVGNLGTAGLVVATGNVTGGNLTTGGVLSVTGNANVGNLGTAGLIVATGNVTGGNLVTGGALSVTGNANVGNLGTGGLIVATGNVTGGNLTTGGVLSVTGNANVGNLGTGGLIVATGNVTGGNLTTGGVLSVTGNATVGNLSTAGLVVATGNVTGGNLTTGGVLSVTGNANVGNLGTAGLIVATGDITGGNINTAGNVTANILVSNVATGTAPITVTSTTRIANLNVSYANVADFINTNLVTTGTFYPVLANATSGNVAESANANLSFNAANGALSATTFVGALSGAATSASTAGTVTTAAQPNITSVSTSFTSLTFANAQTISGNNMTLTTGANTNAGTITGNWLLSTGSRLQATYADLAEYYETDAHYEPGTVLEFGGDKEVTLAQDGTARVAGVVSTDPAYAMNAKCPGLAIAIALQGRVPTKVRGSVRKGDMMVSAGNGYARPWNNPQMGTVIGKALENFDGVEGVIEIAVGRL
jgi:filamentous hemagglutinin